MRDDAPEPPSPFAVVRGTVYFDRLPDVKHVNFAERRPEEEGICLRFLQFTLQNPLSNNLSLWQPRTGGPFYEKRAIEDQSPTAWYRGFAMRVVPSPDGGFGVCLDVRNKFVESAPLPVRVGRQEFRRWKGVHCIYRFGDKWYDIKLQGIDDLTAGEVLIPVEAGRISLVDYIKHATSKPWPDEIADLSADGSAVYYLTHADETRHAPSGLCYPVIPTFSREGRKHHRKTILRVEERRRLINQYARKYLPLLRFGNVVVRTSAEAVKAERRHFAMPDFEFGHGRKVSVRGTPGAKLVALEDVGRMRTDALRSPSAGFFMNDPLLRQYVILPRTVAETFGPQFVKDLGRSVDELFPQKNRFDPEIVIYEDDIRRTFLDQGNAIMEAARKRCTKAGHALVMIHETSDRQIRQHDRLAAMVVRMLREIDIVAAVNHSTMGLDAYRKKAHGRSDVEYEVRRDGWGRFSGYLRNVALNKVLLNNERWPFVLATPLSADLTVGVDVLNNTAGFTLVSRNGSFIRTVCGTSKQKERLSEEQVERLLAELIRKEALAQEISIENVVIHRDGRVFHSELVGMRKAINVLKAEGIAGPNASLTVLELKKSSPVPLRLFDVASGGRVQNAQVGDYIIRGNDGFLCATGRAFARPGTVNPLHVHYVEGGLPFARVLEDLYFLTSLAWTRPEDCSRYPITLKLNDQRLGEDATRYDVDASGVEDSYEGDE